MGWTFGFFFNSLLLGVGLAMDAFSVSLANGLHEPRMARGRMCAIAGVYAFFQAFMPLTGWVLVHTMAERFVWFQGLIPWIGGGLLLWIGGKMLAEGFYRAGEEERPSALGLWELLLQGIATSIDALSAGFALAAYRALQAAAAAGIIAAVTFFICLAGLSLGRRFGILLANRSSILGGVVLTGLGLEMLLRGLL
ncbi:MAG: manganese efflux pump [Oscillibacter sp.]|nr:manganese efflux pump [Oscillibacter sp.]